MSSDSAYGVDLVCLGFTDGAFVPVKLLFDEGMACFSDGVLLGSVAGFFGDHCVAVLTHVLLVPQLVSAVPMAKKLFRQRMCWM